MRDFHVDENSFNQSAHGTVTCRGCHIDIRRTPHEQEGSKVNCGIACHLSADLRGKQSSHMKLYNQYLETAHGELVGKELDCLSCHVRNETKGYARRHHKEVESLCEKCHLKEQASSGGIASGGPKVTGDVYHRLSVLRSRPDLPGCVDCHPVHSIYPKENPISSVNTENLPKTCGGAHSPLQSCHVAASARFIGTEIHDRNLAARNGRATREKTLWLGMMLLLAPLALHMLFDSFRSGRLRHDGTEDQGDSRVFVRMTVHQRALHMLLIVFFAFSAAGGLSLWLCDRKPAAGLISFVGGFKQMSNLHLGGAGALAALIVYHVASLVFLAVKRDWVISDLTLLPRRKDVTDLLQNAWFLLGRSPERPRYGKFSFVQKFDYLAALLGLSFMIVTGLAIGFPERSICAVLPARWLGDLRIVHVALGYGLIFIFLVWHVGNNLFSPATFLRNWSWVNGKISEDMMRQEHTQYYEDMLLAEQEEKLRRERAVEERSMEEVIKKQARELEEYLEAGNQYAKQADYAKAVEQYEKALGLLPNFPQAQYNLATVCHKSGNIKRAIVEYRKFIEIDPFNTVADKVRALLSQLEDSPDRGSADAR